jgi:hypothetical protein
MSDAVKKLKEARKKLNSYVPPNGDEDETYTELNNEVLRLEKKVPWHRR